MLRRDMANHLKVVTDHSDNEYHDMDQTLVLNLNQAAINGIRGAGATSQYIFAEGNSYSGAWTWPSVNDNLKGLTDPQNKLVYEMHQYLDSDGSGTSATCVNSTIGQDRVEAATQWLIQNNKLGFLGEFAGGVNSVCEDAVTGMLNYLEQNSNVWLGAEWWAAGPWWADYIFSMEPPSGTAYSTYMPILKSYLPGSSGSSGSGSGSSSGSGSGSGSGTAAHWAQCGGEGYSGTTTCAAPYTCTYSNAWYSQCL